MPGAAVANSMVRSSEVRKAFEDLREGEIELRFLAPEQFNSEEAFKRVKRAKPSLFVVDEAHGLDRIAEAQKPGIVVYMGTRKHTEDLAEALLDRREKAVCYLPG